MNVFEIARSLLSAPYGVRADGTVFSVGGEETGWTGVKKVAGKMALRWDGRVLTDGWWEERNRAITQWRRVKDISDCHPLEGALLENGDLTWINHGSIGHLTCGHLRAGWTDVERFAITRDPYDRERSYADYAVGFRADDTVRVAYMGGGEDRSREIEEFLNGFGGVKKVSEDCRVLTADGAIYDFGTRKLGKKEKGTFADFDLPAGSGAVMARDGCVLLEDGTVQLPEGTYEAATGPEWHDILTISTAFLPIETGRHILMALRKDGQVFLAERYGNEPADTSGWKLFDSLDTLPGEWEGAKERCIAEGFRLDREEEERARRAALKRLTEERLYAKLALEQMKRELTQIHGLFSGGKRKKLEEDIAAQEKRLAELEEELKKYD